MRIIVIIVIVVTVVIAFCLEQNPCRMSRKVVTILLFVLQLDFMIQYYILDNLLIFQPRCASFMVGMQSSTSP